MPYTKDLEEWADEQNDATAAYFNDPDAFYDYQIQLHTDESRQAIPIIQGLLQDQTNTATRAASCAASDIAHICKSRLETNEEVQMPLGPWLVICRAIEHFASENESLEKLIGLIVELSKTHVHDASGNLVRAKEGRLIFWSELPGWNLAFRDHLTGLPGRGSYADKSNDIAHWHRRFRNGNLFQAHWLSQVGTGLDRQYQYATSLALQSLRDALETKVEDSPVGLRRTELYALGVLPWFWEAGPSLLQLCQIKHRHDGATKVLTPPWLDEGVVEYTYAGDDGFHMVRWAVWKAALRRTAGSEGIGHEVARKAAAVAEEMDRLEGQ